MKTFKQHLIEKVEYYLDTSQDNNNRYVAYDGDYWYTGFTGVTSGDEPEMFLKLVRTHGRNRYFEKAKLKKVTPKELEKDVNVSGGVDFKKLYKR